MTFGVTKWLCAGSWQVAEMFDMFGGSATRHECDRQICRHKNTHVQHNIAINMFQLQPRQNVVSIRYLILYWAVGEYNVRFQIKISRRSTNNSLYLANDIQDSTIYSYYGTLIETRMRSIEWCHFQWPWVTPNRFQRRPIRSYYRCPRRIVCAADARSVCDS